ncbi:TonB-dependent receptor [Peristeroidobacter soli]|uniref:TonB-dependent receptor n=1 Tax=Peristeroidobacter soli TaxID=2497877 RepID=UPI00101BF980|nr:TonB-dependent receptor [Peristeroidobacter soli]
MRTRKLVTHLVCGCLATGGVAAAQAQTTSSDAAATQTGETLESIIVTARKKNESILKVPVVMTAITQESLEQHATDDLYTVAQRVPGLLIGTSLAANGLQVSIRGIGTTANNATVDNSISLNVDGLQLTQGLAYGIGMFDVAQVEVMKGPQALFYGKNSPAGVISLRSVDPTDTFESSARVGYEYEAEEKIAEAMISGPVSDSVKLRLAARYSDQAGYFRNDAEVIPGLASINPTDRRVTPTEDVIVRGTALFTPDGPYSAKLKTSYQYTDMQGTWPANELGYCPDGTGGVAPRNISFIAGDDCKINRSIRVAWPDPAVFTGLRNGGKPFNTQKQLLTSLEQNINFGNGLTLTSLTGYYWLNQEYLYLASVIGGASALVSDSDFDSDQLTQEFRLASDYDGPINFTLGGFYQDGMQKTAVRLRGNTVLGLADTLNDFAHHIDIDSISFFGQVVWKIAPDLELAPGARWTREKRSHEQYNYNAANGPVGKSVLLDPEIEATNVSPEVTLTYSATDDLTLFAAYKTGFKSGSFNGVIFLTPTTAGSFDDEKVKGGEVGLKSRLLDRQLSFNAAAYYYKYSNLQVGANEISGVTGALILRTLNAASADVYGVDMDATFAPFSIPGFSVQAALNYNRARYTSFPNAPCGNGQTIGQGCDQLLNPATGRYTSQDLEGEPLVRAPEWMGSLGFDYEMPVGDTLRLSFGTLASFSSKYSLNLINAPGFFQDDYVKAGANVTLKAGEKWELALIGNNLNDKITAANCFNSNSQNGVFFGGQVAGAVLPGPAGSDEASCVAERGREVWLRATFRM